MGFLLWCLFSVAVVSAFAFCVGRKFGWSHLQTAIICFAAAGACATAALVMAECYFTLVEDDQHGRDVAAWCQYLQPVWCENLILGVIVGTLGIFGAFVVTFVVAAVDALRRGRLLK